MASTPSSTLSSGVVLNALTAPSRRDGHRERGGIGIVRQLDNGDDVILAEGQPRMLELPAQLLDNRTDRLEPALRLLDHGSPRIRRVCHLNEIGMHDKPPICRAGSAPAVGHVLHPRGSHECLAAAIRRRQLGCGRRRPHTPQRVSYQSSASRLVDTEVRADRDARYAGYTRDDLA